MLKHLNLILNLICLLCNIFSWLLKIEPLKCLTQVLKNNMAKSFSWHWLFVLKKYILLIVIIIILIFFLIFLKYEISIFYYFLL
jgi:hypothetical protein